MYSPVWTASTDSILNMLILWFILATEAPCNRFTGFRLKSHEIFTGKSPFITVHWVLTMSPAFITSSPKEKWEICGGTAKTQKKNILKAYVNCKKKKKIPLTFKMVEYRPSPAKFSATHKYSPAWIASTDSILSILIRWFILAIATPCNILTGFPLNNQRILSGKSPLVTAHCVLAISPEFTTSSAKEKWAICGGTKIIFGYTTDTFLRWHKNRDF